MLDPTMTHIPFETCQGEPAQIQSWAAVADRAECKSAAQLIQELVVHEGLQLPHKCICRQHIDIQVQLHSTNY